MENENKRKGRLISWFIFVVGAIAVYKILDNLPSVSGWLGNFFKVIRPFGFGILIAYILYLPTKKIETLFMKTRIKFISKKARTIAIAIVYILAIFLIALSIKFIIPPIAQSIVDLINDLPHYYEAAIDKLESLPEDNLLNRINAKQIISNLETINIDKFLNFESLTGYAKGVINFASGIVDFFIAIVVSIYILSERNEILRFFKKLSAAIFKDKTHESLGKYFETTNNIFFKFLTSQIVDAIIVGIITSVAMIILDVKYAVLLGFMIGLFNLIPYFGAIIAVAVAILVTILTGGISQALWTGAIVIVLQQIDANIINPKITGNSLKISPILVIFSVTVCGAYFGLIGMFLSAPIVTVLKTFLIDYIDYKNRLKEEKKVLEK